MIAWFTDCTALAERQCCDCSRGQHWQAFSPCDRALDSCAVDSRQRHRRLLTVSLLVCALLFRTLDIMERLSTIPSNSHRARSPDVRHLDRLGSFSARILPRVERMRSGLLLAAFG